MHILRLPVDDQEPGEHMRARGIRCFCHLSHISDPLLSCWGSRETGVVLEAVWFFWLERPVCSY